CPVLYRWPDVFVRPDDRRSRSDGGQPHRLGCHHGGRRRGYVRPVGADGHRHAHELGTALLWHHPALRAIMPVNEHGGPMDVQIRPAAPADYAELCEVFAEIDSYHARALPHIFQTPPGPARSRAYVRGILDDPDAALFVAVADGEIVGLVDVRQHTTADIPILVPRRFAVIDAIV